MRDKVSLVSPVVGLFICVACYAAEQPMLRKEAMVIVCTKDTATPTVTLVSRTIHNRPTPLRFEAIDEQNRHLKRGIVGLNLTQVVSLQGCPTRLCLFLLDSGNNGYFFQSKAPFCFLASKVYCLHVYAFAGTLYFYVPPQAQRVEIWALCQSPGEGAALRVKDGAGKEMGFLAGELPSWTPLRMSPAPEQCAQAYPVSRKTNAVLWEPNRVTEEISAGVIFRNLSASEQKVIMEFPVSELTGKVTEALKNPKPLDICMPVFNIVLAAQYYEVFEALNLPRELSVYEPCAGASHPVILATEAYTHGKARYSTINLNRKLREQLQVKIAHLKMEIRIIEDNAQRALTHLQPDTYHLACFHHAVNDILETAVSEPRGLDTTTIDWFSTERQMIEWLAEDTKAGLLPMCGKPQLMQIIADAVRLVRTGGYLIFDHFNWEKYRNVEWFPWELFYNLIPMTRRWIAESGLPVGEVMLPGADPQWWMFVRVKK